MLIGILATGARNERLSERYGSNAEMLMEALREVSPAFTFKCFRVRENVFPDSATACDGWLVTGSDHSVYEELPWMLKTEELLRQALAVHRPVVGICFGHQLLAKALGGKVVKSEKGWGLGLLSYQLHESGETVTLPAYHQDQVVEVPEKARLLGGSEFCPHAILAYDNLGLTFQAHPEFSPDYLSVLIENDMGGKPEYAAIVDRAQQSLLKETSSAATVSRWIGDFLLQHYKKG
jgi:GMP synthase-like glutamine amidotransferase